MGLGKTVMLLALILKSKEGGLSSTRCEKIEHVADAVESASGGAGKSNVTSGTNTASDHITGTCTTTLVVAPLSLLSQWEEEIISKTQLTHQVYYGEKKVELLNAKSLLSVDVVITTCESVCTQRCFFTNTSLRLSL